MTSIPTNSPSIPKSDYVDDNTKVYADITGNLNVRSGPSTSYEVLTQVTRYDQYTRIKKGVQNGERWDKVVLQNGIVGYVFQSYLKEVPNVVESKLEEGILVEFDNILDVNGNEISNLNINNLKVSNIRNLINTNMIIEFYRASGEKLEENENVGTGSRLIIKNNNGEIVYEYKFILYGDVNGDGYINSLDVLVLQKHILEIKPLTGEFLKAGNISRNGNTPTSLDVLKIQKYILELADIKQGEEKSAVSIKMFDPENYVENTDEVESDNNGINNTFSNKEEVNEQRGQETEIDNDTSIIEEELNNNDITQKTQEDIAEKGVNDSVMQEEENSQLVEKNLEENNIEIDEEKNSDLSKKKDKKNI